ncbi:MAG: HAD-IIIC family phosphatase [Candidatus Korobacteraceae bacterium]
MSSSQLSGALQRLRREWSYTAYAAAANAVEAAGEELPEYKVAWLRDITVEPLIPVVKAEIALTGARPQIYVGGFDAIASEVLDPASALYQFKPDLIFLTHWLEALNFHLARRFISLSPAEVEAASTTILEDIERHLAAARKFTNATILINNFPLPDFTTLGILDANSKQSQSEMIQRLNGGLKEIAGRVPDVLIVDFLQLFAHIGSAQGFSARDWHMSRTPFSRHALVPIGQEYGKFIRALRGKSRKCLVLDCDNTLWGGILGEDGLDGIKLGATHPGSWYVEFQQEILNLHDRGVILALCSKNNEEDVLEALRRHPSQVLREEHFACHQINWDDKVTNLRRIAQQLNIGLDSLVFVDDNPLECGFVREQLPEVEVIELPNDPSAFRTALLARGLFETLTISREDRERTRMYRADSERQKIMQDAGSLEDYLAKLQLVAHIDVPDRSTLARVAQLTQKTNQFNLTTIRYTAGQIQSLTDGADSDVFYIRLSDRVADLGIIGAGILRYHDDTAMVDTLLMSCRALGRGVENALAAFLVNAAQANGCSRLVAHYEATRKNMQVAEFYGKVGFQCLRTDEAGSDWKRRLGKQAAPFPHWMKVIISEAALRAKRTSAAAS